MNIHYGNSTDAQKQFIENRIHSMLGPCQSMLVDGLFFKDERHCDRTLDDCVNLFVPVCPECGELAIMVGGEWEKDCRCKPANPDYFGETVAAKDWDTEPQEVFEWWCIRDPWLQEKLIGIGEVVLDNDYGTWWGRTCTGQSIICDPTFWDIFQEGLKD